MPGGSRQQQTGGGHTSSGYVWNMTVKAFPRPQLKLTSKHKWQKCISGGKKLIKQNSWARVWNNVIICMLKGTVSPYFRMLTLKCSCSLTRESIDWRRLKNSDVDFLIKPTLTPVDPLFPSLCVLKEFKTIPWLRIKSQKFEMNDLSWNIETHI